MGNSLLEQLADKSITKDKLKEKVKTNFNLLPELISGMSSDKAAIRYGCGKILMDLSEETPEKLYPHMDSFIEYLDSNIESLLGRLWQLLQI